MKWLAILVGAFFIGLACSQIIKEEGKAIFWCIILCSIWTIFVYIIY